MVSAFICDSFLVCSECFLLNDITACTGGVSRWVDFQGESTLSNNLSGCAYFRVITSLLSAVKQEASTVLLIVRHMHTCLLYPPLSPSLSLPLSPSLFLSLSLSLTRASVCVVDSNQQMVRAKVEPRSACLSLSYG